MATRGADVAQSRAWARCWRCWGCAGLPVPGPRVQCARFPRSGGGTGGWVKGDAGRVEGAGLRWWRLETEWDVGCIGVRLVR